MKKVISSTRIHNGVEAYLNLQYNSVVSAILIKILRPPEHMRTSPHFGAC